MAAKKPAVKRTATPRSTTKFLRNLRYVPVSCRVSDGRRIELKPRGMRGDAVQVSKEELADSRTQQNIDLIFEVLTETQIKKVWEDQLTNQQAHHPAIETLLNDKGQKFDNKQVVIKERSFHEQGVTVAELSNGQMVIDRGIGVKRFSGMGTQDHPIPSVPHEVPADQQADWLARQNVEGPAAGLGNLNVTIDEPQKG